MNHTENVDLAVEVLARNGLVLEALPDGKYGASKASICAFVSNLSRAKTYPWMLWESPTLCWTVTEGDDFTITPDAFRRELYHRAAKQGLKVKVDILAPTVEEPKTRVQFRFMPREEAA